MAGTLYRVDYVGQTAGAAVVYIGSDGVTGMDAGGGIFSGHIAVLGGRARGTVVVTYANGGHLVTGQTISPGGTVTIDFDERANYDDGQPVNFSIGGVPLIVTFTRISAIPLREEYLPSAKILPEARICPLCESPMRVVAEKPHPFLAPVGLKVHEMECSSCGNKVERDFDGSKYV